MHLTLNWRNGNNPHTHVHTQHTSFVLPFRSPSLPLTGQGLVTPLHWRRSWHLLHPRSFSPFFSLFPCPWQERCGLGRHRIMNGRGANTVIRHSYVQRKEAAASLHEAITLSVALWRCAPASCRENWTNEDTENHVLLLLRTRSPSSWLFA